MFDLTYFTQLTSTINNSSSLLHTYKVDAFHPQMHTQLLKTKGAGTNLNGRVRNWNIMPRTQGQPLQAPGMNRNWEGGITEVFGGCPVPSMHGIAERGGCLHAKGDVLEERLRTDSQTPVANVLKHWGQQRAPHKTSGMRGLCGPNRDPALAGKDLDDALNEAVQVTDKAWKTASLQASATFMCSLAKEAAMNRRHCAMLQLKTRIYILEQCERISVWLCDSLHQSS